MKLAISLAAPLLAVLAQPALAAEPGPADADPRLESAVLRAPVRAGDLRRIADAIVLDDARAPRADQRQAIEAMKARVKAALDDARSRDPAECKDCPDKTANRPPRSASPISAEGVRKIDCIHCTDRPATA